MRINPTLIQISMRVEIVRLVWVRAYVRRYKDMFVKVRGHYRRY